MPREYDFVSLHNHSDCSLLDGLGTISEYIERIGELKQVGLGLTDHGNGHGLFEFMTKAREADVIGVPGVEFYVAPVNPLGARVKEKVLYSTAGSSFDVASSGAYLHLTVWAYTETGMHNLFKLLSLSNEAENFYVKPRIDTQMLFDYSDGLIVSTGCPSSEISTRLLLGQEDKAYEYLARLYDVFGKDRLFVEIMNHHMPTKGGGKSIEDLLLPKQLEMAKKMGLPLLATNDSHYAKPDDHRSHEEFLCIQSAAKMSDKIYDEGGNRFAFSGREYYLRDTEEMNAIFPDDDFPGAVKNTLVVAEMAQGLKLSYNPHLRPAPQAEAGSPLIEVYKKAVLKGLRERFGPSEELKKNNPKLMAEINRRYKEEMETLYSSDFVGYMLTVGDYINEANEKHSVRDSEGHIIAKATGCGRGCFLPSSEGKLSHKVNLLTLPDGTFMGIESYIKSCLLIPLVGHDSKTHKRGPTFSYPSIKDEICAEILLDNGHSLACTLDHLLFTKDMGFVPAGEMKVGDKLLGQDGKGGHIEYTVVKIRKFPYNGEVFDIEIPDVHNYTIGMITAHNSVGGSLHAYALGISDVDPIRHNLLFSRFLSAGRGATDRITYTDGTSEDVIVSEVKTVREADGTLRRKYVHELEESDVVVVGDEDE